MIFDELLDKHFPELDVALRAKVIRNSVLFLFQELTLGQFNARIRKHTDTTRVVPYRLDLTTNGRVFKAKTYLYRAYCTRDKEASWEVCLMTDVDRGIDRLLDDRVLRKTWSKLRHDYVPWSWSRIQHMVELDWKDASLYATKLVNRKLAFIVRAGQASKQELRDELLYEAVRNVYKTYPRIESKLHVKNIIRRCMSNMAINQIYHFTSDSRQSMRNEEEGGQRKFKNLVYRLDLMPHSHASMCVEASNEQGLTLTHLMGRYHGKQRTFIKLMTGEPDAAFSAWLHEEGYLTEVGSTNADLFDRYLKNDAIHRYQRRAARFLELKDVAAFVKQLQQDVGGSYEPDNATPFKPMEYT